MVFRLSLPLWPLPLGMGRPPGMPCPACGTPHPAHHAYCAACGSKLGLRTAASAGAAAGGGTPNRNAAFAGPSATTTPATALVYTSRPVQERTWGDRAARLYVYLSAAVLVFWLASSRGYLRMLPGAAAWSTPGTTEALSAQAGTWVGEQRKHVSQGLVWLADRTAAPPVAPPAAEPAQ